MLDVSKPRVTARVVHGGQLSSHKGINLPGVQVSAPSITEKDREDIAFAVEQELEYIALSFVRRAQDIAELRQLVPKHDARRREDREGLGAREHRDRSCARPTA